MNNFLFFIAYFLQCFYSSFMFFSLTSWNYSQNNSAIELSFIFIIGAIPRIILVLFAGFIVDKINKKLVTLICFFTSFISISFLQNIEGNNLLGFTLLLCLESIATSFISCIFPSIQKNLDPPSNNPDKFSSWLFSASNTAMIIATIFGGYFLFQIGFIFSLDIAKLIILSYTILILIGIKFNKVSESETTIGLRIFFKELKEHIILIKKDREIFSGLTNVLILNLLAGSSPILASVMILKSMNDTKYLGYMHAAIALGSLIIAIFISGKGLPKKLELYTKISYIAATSSCLIIVVTSNKIALFLAFLIIAASAAYVSIYCYTTIQKKSTLNNIGSFSSVRFIIIWISLMLSRSISGIFIETTTLLYKRFEISFDPSKSYYFVYFILLSIYIIKTTIKNNVLNENKIINIKN